MSRVEFPAVSVYSIHSVTGEGSRGEEIMNKIHEKSHRYMAEYGREPKHMVLDAQSYLDLYAYHEYSTRAYLSITSEPEGIFTRFGKLTPIVLPQTKKRIQVIGDDPMFTATQTLIREQE